MSDFARQLESELSHSRLAVVEAISYADIEAEIAHIKDNGGRWEGYGPVKRTRYGNECAQTIRALKDAGGEG